MRRQVLLVGLQHDKLVLELNLDMMVAVLTILTMQLIAGGSGCRDCGVRRSLLLHERLSGARLAWPARAAARVCIRRTLLVSLVCRPTSTGSSRDLRYRPTRAAATVDVHAVTVV